MSTIIDDKVVAGAQDPNIVKEDPIVALTENVRVLYTFRDHYFETHPIDAAINKNKDVEKEMKNTLIKFDECKGYEIDGSRAKYYYLKGKTLNVTDKYTPQAEELLSKAVKLEPKLIEAWNELGECYWKNDDIKQAKNCFIGALPHGKNKVSLRNLSMVLRQEPTLSTEERIKNVQEGLEYAKEAVNFDPSDGTSWTILGNAYLSSYFTISQNPVILRSCMSAYKQAERNVISKSNPDLHYNKAMALKYQEEYHLALKSLHQACLLDPTWDVPKEKEIELLKYIENIQTSISTKGSVKPKKLFQLIKSLNEKHLGPYAGGSYSSGDKTVKLELKHLKDLKLGINIETAVFGKVICWIQDSDSVPFTFCIVDDEGTCMAVTLYNLAKGKGVTVGDSIAIPEPFLSEHKFEYSDKKFNFKSIRIETPVVLVVNGKKLARNQQACITMSMFKKSD